MSIASVLVVEDQKMFREFLVGWLKGAGYEVTGAAGSLAEAEESCRERDPDLILLDLDLPDGEGLEFVDRQVSRRPTTRILVLTAHVESYPVVKLKRGGVMGALDKAETSGAELERALNVIGQWRTYYSDRVERSFRNLVRESTAFYKTLSPREEQMVKYFGQGRSNEGIAQMLGLSVATVQGHRRNVMGKIGVRSTPELIIWAIQNGFVRGPQINRMDRVESQGRGI